MFDLAKVFAGFRLRIPGYLWEPDIALPGTVAATLWRLKRGPA